MFGLSLELKDLVAQQQRQITISLVGAGQMGTDVIAQMAQMPAMRPVVIVDIDSDRARSAYTIGGYPGEPVRTVSTLDEVNQALLAGKTAAATDYRLATDPAQIEAVVEATGHPEVSSRTILRAIRQKKHVITMSAEMDITVGPLLGWFARRHGVVYTLAAGDEPAALYELYDFVTALGLKVVAAGKGKNNPLNRDATPDELKAEAARRGLTPEMLVEFVDGSKTQIEMACIANATGLTPDIRGMHGPKTTVKELARTFVSKEQGGLLSRTGVVDYMIGDLAPGVFVVFTTDCQRLRDCLVLRDMGKGPNYALVRPYHLCSMEVPLSVAHAVLRRQSTMPTRDRLSAEVLTVAKKDLPPGTALERIGGRTHYGLIEHFDRATEMRALPLGISRGCTTTRAIRKGEIITYADVTLPADQLVIELRHLQDAWMAGKLDEAALWQKMNDLMAKADVR